jgi:hypothetical protein
MEKYTVITDDRPAKYYIETKYFSYMGMSRMRIIYTDNLEQATIYNSYEEANEVCNELGRLTHIVLELAK